MKDGSAQTYLTEEKSLDILYFKDFLYDFKVLYDKKVIKQKDTVKETRTTQLIESLISTDSLTRLDTESIKTEIHRRISETLLPTVIILLGFSCLIVTKFTRQQTWLPTAIAISLTVLLQLLANYFEDLNRSNIIGIWGYYIAPIFGGLLLTLLSLEINLKKNDSGNVV